MSDFSFSVLVDFKNLCKDHSFFYDDHIQNIEESYNFTSPDVFIANMEYCKGYVNTIHNYTTLPVSVKKDLLNKYMALWLKTSFGIIYGKKSHECIKDNPHYIAQYCGVVSLMKYIFDILKTYPDMEEVVQLYNGFFLVNAKYLPQ